jgi:hypothetical protein
VSGNPPVTGFELYNTILAYNADPNGDPDCHGTFALDDKNIISQTSPECDLTSVGQGDQLDVDPLLGPLADNGGNTLTHALLAASPARDEGTDCPSPFVAGGAAPQGGGGAPDTGQRGFPRPAGPECDIGAFEGDAPLIWGDNLCTGAVDAVDGLGVLLAEFELGLPVEPGPDCPVFGESVFVGPDGYFWADTDCDEDVDPDDAIPILRYLADLAPAPNPNCPLVGEPLIAVG